MKRKLSLLIVFVLFSQLLPAGAVLSLKNGGNKWGYSASHAALVQKWDGSDFIADMELIPPQSGKPGRLARESWFGFYVEDTKRSHRFSPGLFNPSWDAAPKELQFSAISYINRGNYRVETGTKKWTFSPAPLKLRVELKTGKLTLFIQEKDSFIEALSIAVPADFAPDRVGISLDSCHSATEINGLEVKSFSITGAGKSLKEMFDGKCNLDWNVLDEKRLVFEPPCMFGLDWKAPESGCNVFDTGTDGQFCFAARSTVYAGRKADIEFRCFDQSGQELYSGKFPFGLTAKPTEKTFHIPGSVLGRNGVYRLHLAASLDGKPLEEAEQQFAVISPHPVTPGQFDDRSPYSTNYFNDWHLAARIGIRKVRQTYWSVKDFEDHRYAELAVKNGLLINGPYLKGGVKESPEALREKAAEVASIFLELQKRYPNIIYCQEFYNEPENWPPTGRLTDLTPFAALFRPIKEELRRAGSDLKLMSTGTTHVNLSFLKKIAMLSGRDAVDIVAVHGYRSPARPEFGHEEDIAAIRDLFGQEKPVYVNEDAYFALTTPPKGEESSITQPFNSMIELDELTHGVYIQRKWLNQLMAGYSLVNQFDSIRNHSLSENEFHRRPGIVTVAALTKILPHPVFEKRLTESIDHLWILQWRNDGAPVYTVWTLNDFHRVALESDVDLTVYDAFGNVVSSGKQVSFVAGGAPHFIRGGEIRLVSRALTDELPSIVLPEETPLVAKPLGIAVAGAARDGKTSLVRITLKNNTAQLYRGEISPCFMNNAPANWTFVPAAQSVEMKSGEIRTLEFATSNMDPYHPEAGAGYNALWWTEGFRVAVKADGKVIYCSQRSLCLRGIPYNGSIKIDGNQEDWNAIPEFGRIEGEKKRNVALSRFWTGKADYDPVFKFAWRPEGLLFLAVVTDDKHDASETGLNAWRTDSVQLGLNARHANPDYTDYAVITLSTGSPAVLQRDMRHRKAGPLPEVVFRHRRMEGDEKEPGRTLYECLIPWNVFGFKPEAGATFGFCVLFNESDGYWRKGWTGYFMPMGGQIVDPRLFGDLTLIR